MPVNLYIISRVMLKYCEFNNITPIKNAKNAKKNKNKNKKHTVGTFPKFNGESEDPNANIYLLNFLP
jgi:hypothetical protein